MAFKRKQVVEKVESMAEPISDHIVKCIIYGDSLGCLDDWKKELASFFWSINIYEVKRQKRLKKSEYIYFLFDEIANELSDCKARIVEFIVKNQVSKKYPDVDYNDKQSEDMLNVVNAFKSNIPDMLSDKSKIYSKEEYLSIVDKVISNIN